MAIPQQLNWLAGFTQKCEIQEQEFQAKVEAGDPDAIVRQAKTIEALKRAGMSIKKSSEMQVERSANAAKKKARDAKKRKERARAKEKNLWAVVVKHRKNHAQALKRLHEWRRQNIAEKDHDCYKTDLLLLKNFLHDCEMGWGSGELGEALENLLDRWTKEDYDV